MLVAFKYIQQLIPPHFMISLIIAVYKRLDFLELVFASLKQQTCKNFEVVIAEDARDEATARFIERMRLAAGFPVLHVSQQDDGFRKTTILNQAVRASTGEKLVFIDGDCVLHPRFLETYEKNIAPGYFYFGRRCMVSEPFTQELLATKDLKKITLLNLIRSESRYVENAVYIPLNFMPDKPYRQIWGCNWGVLRSQVLAVNGFDQDYNEACAGEDLDIDWRLKATGLKIRSVKHQAIEYHLHHKVNYDKGVQLRMEALMATKIQTGRFFCQNGLTQV